MRRKKIEVSEETTDETAQDTTETQEQPKDVKLGEFQLKDYSVLVIKKTNYKGEDRIDFRVWLNSPKYKGPTKQGFVVTMDKIDAFIEAVEKIKEKLKDAK